MNFNPYLATLFVAIGGGCGAVSRFWLGYWVKQQSWGKDLFWGTLIINITGSVLLGVVAGYFKERTSTGFLLLGTGFCGGYTTFSTFSLEVTEALRQNRVFDAFLYILASVIGGFLGFVLAWMAFSSSKS